MNNGDSRPDRSGPITDLRVVDFTQMLAGPFATMVLADLGADIVKIEPPTGDRTRDNPPQMEEGEDFGGYFQSINRGKRSVSVDLTTDSGRDAVLKLIEVADIVVENFRVGTMERLGLSYETLEEHNPELIYASIRGFGDPRGGLSPYADQPAFDPIAQAMGGLMSITGTKESGPIKTGPGIGDTFPALLVVVGILSAVHERQTSGRGQYVDVGMVDGILYATERIVHQYSYTGEAPGRHPGGHPLFFPFDCFEASDGYFVIAAPTDKQWKALCREMDRPDLVAEYPTKHDRGLHQSELRPIVSDWTRQHTTEKLFERLREEVPCGPVYTAADIFRDPHFDSRDLLVDIDHADTGQSGTITGVPIKLTETPGDVQWPAPFLGEDTETVLSEAGLDQERIGELRESDVIHCFQPETKD